MTDQFMTPLWLAQRMVQAARLRHLSASAAFRVLEPSAGTGVIVRELRRHPRAHVTAVELDPTMHEALVGHAVQPHEAILGDFLEYRPQPGAFDLCVMNPPYTHDLDFLEHAGTLAKEVIALVRLNALAGVKRYAEVWSKAAILKIAILPRRPRFHGPSDKGLTARHDFAVVHYRFGGLAPAGGTVVEWWSP